jgi:predicted heme/steroid binding protein
VNSKGVVTNRSKGNAVAWNNGDVYVGHDGNVYQHDQGGGWQQHTSSGWQQAQPNADVSNNLEQQRQARSNGDQRFNQTESRWNGGNAGAARSGNADGLRGGASGAGGGFHGGGRFRR